MINPVGKSLGRYHITEQLGEGGMATVYKGYDTLLERNVAIKVIRTERGSQADFLKRFQREARALAHLDHPFILKVLDYGEQDGTPFLVMPFVPGGTLKQKLNRKIPYQEAAAMLSQVARALEYAHKQGVIHRDVKPANILVDSSGSPLLSDFGIAKMLDSQESTQLTGTGVGIGTPDYMAPEQWLGHANRATDIYALGVVFYEMVTGNRPFVADTPAAVLLKHMNDPLPRPKSFAPELPESVEQVIYKALAKKPEDRFGEMGAFAGALEALAREETPTIQVNPSPDDEAAMQVLAEKSVFQLEARSGTPPISVKPGQNKISKWTVGGLLVLGIGIMAVVCVAGGLVYLVTRGARPDQVQPVETSTVTFPSTVEEKDVSPTLEVTQYPETKNTPLSSIEGLPADIPVLSTNNGDLTIMTQQDLKIYMFTTSLSMEEVITYYHDAMIENGWEEMSTGEQPGQYLMRTYQKTAETQLRMAIIMASESAGSTMISIQVPVAIDQ